MKRMLFFARRNALEILREPISLFFGVLFPVVLLALLSLINSAIPAEANMTLYHIENLAPGIASFGLCFLSLFASMLISKDRCSSFMLRLRTSPLRSWEYIAGYCLPMLPMGMAANHRHSGHGCGPAADRLPVHRTGPARRQRVV